jgi:glycosyltransferase involved in cell wall biosynthesis
MARQRNRPIENRWIGQRIGDPEPDLAMIARGQGLTGYGPVQDANELERVLATGPLEDLGAYLAQADVLVSPRCSGHNTPMKLYSYLAAGKAVLATRIRSHTQVLSDDCALLVEPTAAALAGGFDALLRSPALRARLGQAARHLAATRYSVAQFRKSVASAYRRLAVVGSP